MYNSVQLKELKVGNFQLIIQEGNEVSKVEGVIGNLPFN